MQRFLDDIEALINETVDMGNLASEMLRPSVEFSFGSVYSTPL